MTGDPEVAPRSPTLRDGFDPVRYERIIVGIRSASGRLTVARRAIITTLLRAASHITAEDVANTVAGEYPEVHLSTVYRTLDALERLGVIDHVHLGHGRAVYHLVDDPHQHLVCEQCGGVIEVPDATFGALADQLEKEFKFKIRPHHFALLGRCEACRALRDDSTPDSLMRPKW